MIYYFSGTGNSKWAAEQIAEATGDVALDIVEAGAPASLEGQSQVGFVFPVYAWGVPEPMLEFAKSARPPQDAFSFGVCTCGADAGLTMEKLARAVRLDSAYSLLMPNNYVIDSELDAPDEAFAKIMAAKDECARIAAEVAGRKKAWRVTKGPSAALRSNLVNFGFNKFARSVKPFRATEACDGCGICERRCPAKVISLSSGRPVWQDGCYQCLRCINECPREAIQYGDKTEGRPRYTLSACLKQAGRNGQASRG